MSALDDLLARSRAPGRLVERRTFTLSREKAIEKQREFALRHPSQYVLELVQAAVFSGATYIAIDARPHSLLVAWVGGRPFGERELDALFDYLFADRGDSKVRNLVQLAIGVNAILQRRPRVLRIESGDGETGVRVDFDAQGQPTGGRPAESIAGTYIYAEYGGGWFARFSGNTTTPEQTLVEQRCLYTPVPILLNGTAPFGYRGSRHIQIFGAKYQEHFDEDNRRGVVAMHANPSAARGFRIVVGGVWISTLDLAELASERLVGVVCDDQLRKTADQSDIVQDHRYVAMLHAVQRHATKVMRADPRHGDQYRPPDLPPIPRVEEATGEPARTGPEPEPLPSLLPMLVPRGATTLHALQSVGDTPVFYVEPKHEDALRGRTAEPDRFPWQVLVLTEGQVLTLAQELPGTSLHRLTSKADVDFVRRVVDRRVRVREHLVTGPGFRLSLRLHLEGPLPDWGHGQDGVPFCTIDDRGTLEYGVIEGRSVRVRGSRFPEEQEREIRTKVSLPRVSLKLEVDREGRHFGEAHAALAMTRGWELAVPEKGEPHRILLGALLGALAVPQFVRGEAGAQVAASLPVGWPDSLRHVPLMMLHNGEELSLEGFLALLGTTETRTVDDAEELAALDGLEQRFGYGHLHHRVLETEPLFVAARRHGRWEFLRERDRRSDGITQMVWVAGSFAPRTSDSQWRRVEQPYPELVGVVRQDLEPEDWREGWELLFTSIQSVEGSGSWHRFAHGAITEGRLEGMGRLALIHLAVLLGDHERPLLAQSDGGGRRSVDDIRTHPAARIVARRGVRLAEPWTLALTRDELSVIEEDGSIPQLRYDDGPEVWRSLSETEQGWLVRNKVDNGGVRGWLGLRAPHDGTAGILMRTTGQLIAMAEVDKSVPCHGLLWPEDGGFAISQEQRRIVQLAGLRLYQGLVGILRDRPDPLGFEAACHYATTFVLLAYRRSGRLQGTSAELARLVPVKDAEGQRWDTLEVWLQTAPEQRPELPAGVVPPEDAPSVQNQPMADEDLQQRLRDALGLANTTITLRLREGGPREAPVEVDLATSAYHAATVLLNTGHPLTQRALDSAGRYRELILIESARQVCSWAAFMGIEVDFSRVQLLLLGQRMDAA